MLWKINKNVFNVQLVDSLNESTFICGYFLILTLFKYLFFFVALLSFHTIGLKKKLTKKHRTSKKGWKWNMKTTLRLYLVGVSFGIKQPALSNNCIYLLQGKKCWVQTTRRWPLTARVMLWNVKKHQMLRFECCSWNTWVKKAESFPCCTVHYTLATERMLLIIMGRNS